MIALLSGCVPDLLKALEKVPVIHRKPTSTVHVRTMKIYAVHESTATYAIHAQSIICNEANLVHVCTYI